MRNTKRFHAGLALWAMARPLIMVSVILVYVDGVLIARAHGYGFLWENVLWGLAALIPIAASIHYANEYADVETDALTTRTLYSGGSGILPEGNVSRDLALQAAWGTLTIGFLIALFGYSLGNLNLVTLFCLLLGSFGGWMYSVPPLKLAWCGWGELDNAFLGGLLLHIYGYTTLSQQLTTDIILPCLPFTLLTFNNLLATTWTDRRADASVGKYTLATQLNIVQLRRLYVVVATTAFGLLVILDNWIIPRIVTIASLLAFPIVIWGWRTYTRIHNPYPTSNAMIVLLVAQMIAWYSLT